MQAGSSLASSCILQSGLCVRSICIEEARAAIVIRRQLCMSQVAPQAATLFPMLLPRLGWEQCLSRAVFLLKSPRTVRPLRFLASAGCLHSWTRSLVRRFQKCFVPVSSFCSFLFNSTFISILSLSLLLPCYECSG